MSEDKSKPVTQRTGGAHSAASMAPASSAGAIDAFLEKAKTVAAAPASGRGRLIFALDATMSRQPTWDMAQAVQGRMFEAAAKRGGLDVQLVYFRGLPNAALRVSSQAARGSPRSWPK